MEADPDSPCQ